MNLIDVKIVENNIEPLLELTEKIAAVRSMLIVVCEGLIPEGLEEQFKNWVFIYQDFEKIMIKGKEYFPLRSFR